MSGGLFSAAQAFSGVGVALLCVAVAGAEATVGEAPVTRQTAVTLTAVCPGDTHTLACGLVAERILRSLGIAITGWGERAGKERDECQIQCLYCAIQSTCTQSLFIQSNSHLQPLGPNR